MHGSSEIELDEVVFIYIGNDNNKTEFLSESVEFSGLGSHARNSMMWEKRRVY